MLRFIVRLILVGIVVDCSIGENMGKLLSHKAENQDIKIDAIRSRLRNQTNLTLSIKETLALLDQLTQFELGRFLLKNKGLNGFWTAYIILHGPKRSDLPPLERWLLTEAPVVRATQERFKIFQQELQLRLRSGVTIASVPCGLMDDVLGLDYSGVSNVTLEGIDLDANSIRLAKENALHHGLYDKVKLVQKDAWNLDIKNAYDVITSNGLNIYEPDTQKVIALYKQFYTALKPGGILITSFLTPSPSTSTMSTWKKVQQADALRQKALFSDIIQAGFQTFRTEQEVCQHMEAAGFRIVKVIYDSQGMFPTIVCEKAK